MQALFDYIISTENRYNNAVKIDDKELIVNTEITERDYIFVNRIGTVISCPVSGQQLIQSGDKVILHHNVFRRWLDSHGEEKNSSSYLDENKYAVAPDQIFAYKRDGKWKSLPGFCFVKPIYRDGEWDLKTDENLKGILTYSNDALNSIGLSNGDIVGFTPNSEYEFNIDGVKLYRILSNNITINYGQKATSGQSV